MTMPIAPASFARAALEANVQKPRDTSAIAPSSECAGRSLTGPLGSLLDPHRCRSTGTPSRPTIEPMSTSTWLPPLHDAGIALAPAMNGTCKICAPLESNADSEGANTCEFETAATEIAPGAVPGEPTEPKPNSFRSLPAAITGTTPAAATLLMTGIITSFNGSDSGPPPEKLTTFIPSATADSNASAISVDSAMWPIGVGTLKTR